MKYWPLIVAASGVAMTAVICLVLIEVINNDQVDSIIGVGGIVLCALYIVAGLVMTNQFRKF